MYPSALAEEAIVDAMDENIPKPTSGTALRILLIRDKRPGHFHQSEGVVKAVARKLPVHVDRLTIEPRLLSSKELSRALLNTGWLDARLIYGLSYSTDMPRDKPDLIVSAGGDTLIANAALARIFGCENVLAGSLRNLRPAHFTVILTTRETMKDRPNHEIVIKPNPVDPDDETNEVAPTDLCILIGGSTKSHRYSDHEWHALLRYVEEAAGKCLVTVVTSRRTDRAIAGKLKALSGVHSNFSFVGFSDVKPGENFKYCLGAKAILVTEDSNSMITEAVCARKPVIALRPAHCKPDFDDAAYLRQLQNENWLDRQIMNEDLTVGNIQKRLDRLTPMGENHLEILADRLAERLALFRQR